MEVYYTWDNSGTAAKVEVTARDVKVYRNITPDEFYDLYIGYSGTTDEGRQYMQFDLIYIIPNYDRVFIGEDPIEGEHGNSILVKKGQTYYYIGESLYSFTPTDEILLYISPVGNNGVPYPYAIGKKYIYLIVEKVKMEVDHFYPYTSLYRRETEFTPFETETIHERFLDE